MPQWLFEFESGQMEVVVANTFEAARLTLALWWQVYGTGPLPPVRLKGIV